MPRNSLRSYSDAAKVSHPLSLPKLSNKEDKEDSRIMLNWWQKNIVKAAFFGKLSCPGSQVYTGFEMLHDAVTKSHRARIVIGPPRSLQQEFEWHLNASYV